MMLTWAWTITLLLPSGSAEVPVPLEVRFAKSCRIESVTWADDRLYLLVRNIYHPEIGMAVYVQDNKLYHYSRPIDLLNICGIGRDPTGKLIVVTRLHSPPGGPERLVFDVPGDRSTRAVDANDAEGLVSFLPSRSGAFITDWHIGSSIGGFRSSTLSERLIRFTGAADASGDVVLAGTSGPLARSSKEETGGAWRINMGTGKVERIRLRIATTSPANSVPTDLTLLDPRVDQVAGVLADPNAAGWFYVAFGDLYRGGRLLRVAVDGRCEVVFRRETGPFRQLVGTTPDPELPVGLSKEEGALAVACDSAGTVCFATPRGIYRLGLTEPEFVEVPAFESVGGFLVAHNIPGFVVVLSHQGEMAPWASKVFLVPIPSAPASQSAHRRRNPVSVPQSRPLATDAKP